MNDATADWQPARGERADDALLPALVLVGYPEDPRRLGEVALVPADGEWILGRQGTLDFAEQRPCELRPRGPLADPQLSRHQMRLVRRGERLDVENLGRRPLSLGGRPISSASLTPGDLLQIADRVLLWVTQRPARLGGQAPPKHRLGQEDAQGIVGESPAIWQLRERLSFLARRDQHVLVTGESGTGKELVARALHALSSRAGAPYVSRSAATIPESLADAELFGNLAGYPNPGTPARPGLVGEADRGVLFLDEIGELPVEQQARLLRVMDTGEHSRLGEARARRADLRLIAATNRDPSELKHDLLARFPIRLHVPPLRERREDIPLLAAHLLRHLAREDTEIAERFFTDKTAASSPRMTLVLLRHLVAHPYQANIRELHALLWQSITAADGDTLDVPSAGFLPAASPAPQAPAAPSGPVDPLLLDPKTIQEALDRHAGRQDPVWRELGLASRHVLARLVKKHGLKVRGKGT